MIYFFFLTEVAIHYKIQHNKKPYISFLIVFSFPGILAKNTIVQSSLKQSYFPFTITSNSRIIQDSTEHVHIVFENPYGYLRRCDR